LSELRPGKREGREEKQFTGRRAFVAAADWSGGGAHLGKYRSRQYLLRLRGGNVPDDENGLAGFDQSELAACHFFDGSRIFTETPCLLSQTRVLGAQAGNRGSEPFVLLSGAMHREQAAIAHETIGDNHTGNEEQHDVNDPPVA
jgi:hypothetical protein